MNFICFSGRAEQPAFLTLKSATSLFCALAGCFLQIQPASAASLSQNPAVNNAAAVTELINAIKSAKSGSTINLFPNGVYTLSQADNWEYGPNGLPPISTSLTINGQGATICRATNAPAFRFFYVSGGLSYISKSGSGLAAGSLVMVNLTLTGGYAGGGDGYGQAGGGAGMGGAIFNQGALTMTNVSILDNMAQGGGSFTNGIAGGGGGIGEDSTSMQGGGFGGHFTGVGGHGGTGAAGGGGGGGGFRPTDRGASATSSRAGAGGGLGRLANLGDGGDGGYAGVACGGTNGGAYGFGGTGWGGYGSQSGGGGGIGGGGGHGGFNGADGSGGFGGGGGGGGEYGGDGGFGGGGGGGNGGGSGGFGAGDGNPEDNGGGGGGGLGGAIFNHRGSLCLVNCTLSGNTAQGGNGFDDSGASIRFGGVGGSGLGGAIFNLNGSVSVTGSTLVSNSILPGATATWTMLSGGVFVLTNLPTGDADGGALYNLAYGNRIEDGTASSATVTVANSLLSGSIGGGDLANQAVNGSCSNNATVNFCTNNLVTVCCNYSGGTCTGAPASALVAPASVGSLKPVVAIALVAGNPVIFWPTNFDACSLESSTNFSAPGSWTPMNAVPGVAAGQYVVPDVGASGCKFYRLVTP